MILNILLVLYLLLMIYWWGMQGFFSSLLHLIVVIVAGALALALWEPLVLGFLINRMPNFAWGTGLVGPFLLLVILLRVLTDRAVRANMDFDTLTNWIGGGFCGLLSGILTSGLVLIGIGFLPLGPDGTGYQPLGVGATGQVERVGSLLVPVDRQAAGFFRMVSGGAFSSYPMGLYQPNLANQAELYRLHPDVNASVSALPGDVKVSAYYLVPVGPDLRQALDAIPEAQRPSIGRELKPGHRLVVLETEWQSSDRAGTFDADGGTLRVAAAQIRLVTWDKVKPEEATAAQVYAPIGASRLDPLSETKARDYVGFTQQVQQVNGNNRREKLAWAFVVPEAQAPMRLLVRNLRLLLPARAVNDAADTLAILGRVTPAAGENQPGGTSGGNITPDPRHPTPTHEQGKALVISNDLPVAISANAAAGLNFTADNQVDQGAATVAPQSGTYGPSSMTVTKIQVPGHLAMLRLEISHARVQSLLGNIMASAAAVHGIILEDAAGNQYLPMGYVLRKSDDKQEIKFDRTAEIKSAKQLPTSRMAPADKLYLYFLVPKGAVVTTVHIATAKDKVDPPLSIPR